MNIFAKPLIALACAGILLFVFSGQKVQAALLNESGTAILADTFGTGAGSEDLTVDWTVVENLSGIYTYSYIIENPAGDVVLNNDGTPTSKPEVVDAFGIGFDTTAANAYVPFSQTGGLYDRNSGVNGLYWFFAPVTAGSNSPTLSFQSYLPPGMGNADAEAGAPPSPWASDPYGQQVPIPAPIPESTATLTLLAAALFLLLPFRFAISRLIHRGEKMARVRAAFGRPLAPHPCRRDRIN